MYLINELGKNWDSGTSSLYFVYKPDDNGNYKFYGSPVWDYDYDNSLGNAKGVADDLGDMGVDDYTLPTGWWCKFKGKDKNATYTVNIMNRICRNYQIMAAAPRIWFENFLPAIDHFAQKNYDETINEELYTSEKYFDLIKNSANMNFTSGWSRDEKSTWIASHERMKKAEFNKRTGKYTEYNEKYYYYNNIFEKEFRYAADWLNNRAAWLSKEFYEDYPFQTGDVNRNFDIEIGDATEIQKYLAELVELNNKQRKIADYDDDGEIAVDDATLVQCVLAYLREEPEPKITEPATQPTTSLSNEYKVLFTNSLKWEEPVCCYYWKKTNTNMCTWPGIHVADEESVKENGYGEKQYEFVIPEDAEFVIFNNGKDRDKGGKQTVDIPLDRSVTGYYALKSIDSQGSYKINTWNINE